MNLRRIISQKRFLLRGQSAGQTEDRKFAVFSQRSRDKPKRGPAVLLFLLSEFEDDVVVVTLKSLDRSSAVPLFLSLWRKAIIMRIRMIQIHSLIVIGWRNPSIQSSGTNYPTSMHHRISKETYRGGVYERERKTKDPAKNLSWPPCMLDFRCSLKGTFRKP